MNGIGWAVKQLQDGKRVRRVGWNGKEMWLALVTGSQWYMYDIPHIDVADRPSNLLPWVGMRTADGGFVPWLCSQTDLLSVDWELVD